MDDDDDDDDQSDQHAPADPIAELDNLEGMMDHLKAEHLEALTRGELWDTNTMQSLILQFLDELRQSSGETLRAQCKERMVEVFTDLNRTAIEQN